MAKVKQRGNREAKKPKKEKPKEMVPASGLVNQVNGITPAKPSGGK